MQKASSIIPPAMPPTIAPIGVLRAGAPVTVVDDVGDEVVVETLSS